MSNASVCYAREDAITNLIFVEEFCRNTVTPVTPVTFQNPKWIAGCSGSYPEPSPYTTRVILGGEGE